jgi:hypothetical protein
MPRYFPLILSDSSFTVILPHINGRQITAAVDRASWSWNRTEGLLFGREEKEEEYATIVSSHNLSYRILLDAT